MRITSKVIISGQYFELFEYEKGYFKDFKKHDKGGRNGITTEEEKEKNRELTLGRARGRIRRLINSNVFQYYDTRKRRFKPIFCTLTFAENIQDIPSANREFSKFIMRLNYRLKTKLKYLVVIEFQDRGAIHYHVVFFNLPFLEHKEFAEIWGNGFTWIEAINRVENVGAYVSKYLQKDNDDERLKGKKCFFTSRGLFEPEEITDKKIVESVANSLLPADMIYQSSFENEHVGKVNYKQFKIKNQI